MIVCWKLEAIFARALITSIRIMAKLVTATFINATLIHICAMPQEGIKKKNGKTWQIIKYKMTCKQMHVNKRLLNSGVYPTARGSNRDWSLHTTPFYPWYLIFVTVECFYCSEAFVLVTPDCLVMNALLFAGWFSTICFVWLIGAIVHL